MRKLWCILLFLPFSVFAKPDELPLRFQKITTEHGLPHNFVHAITQDNKGFIWIATNYGIARYDGYNFKIFQPDKHKPHSITHKPIGNVFADSKGYLWLSINSGGINRMDLRTECFKGYFYDESGKNSLGIEQRFFHEDEHGEFWLGTSSGVFLYNSETDGFVNVLTHSKITNAYVNAFADDKCGNLWLIMGNDLVILDKKSFEVLSFKQFTAIKSANEIVATNLFSGEKGKVWITSTQHGLICYDVMNRKAENYLQHVKHLGDVFVDIRSNVFAITNNLEYSLYVCKSQNLTKNQFEVHSLYRSKYFGRNTKFAEDRFGNVWMASPVGMASFNFDNGLINYEANNFDPNSISDNFIENIFIDRTDNLWLCPYRKGVNKADLRQKPFKNHRFNIKSFDDVLRDKNVSSVYEDSKGNIWIGNSNLGIDCYNKHNSNQYRFRLNTLDAVTSIYEDNKGYLWLGTYWDSLYRVKLPEMKICPVKKELSFSKVQNFDIRGVRKIVPDSNNNLWLASSVGLIEWNRVRNEFTNHSELYDSLNSVSSFYRTILIDSEQVIWTGSNSGGLCKYDRKQKKFSHYLHNPENSKSITNNTVYAIVEVSKEHFWVGTGQGLVHFNPKTEAFSPAGEGLYGRSIFSVIPDTLGNLWMSSDIGIIKYNIAAKQSAIYGHADGLQNNEFNTTASFLSKSGEIYFGGTTGLVSFHPANIKANPIHSKPVITNILLHNRVVSPGDSVNGRLLLKKQVWEANRIELFYYENEFTIEFSALHYSAPDKVQYMYKLEGLNSDWVKTNANRRYASYTGLPPGNYTFVLKATNNDGLMCLPDDEVRFSIIIVPPFWHTLWFRLVLVFIALLAVFLFIRYRLKSLRRKNIVLNQKVKERTIDLEKANLYLEDRTRQLEEANTILEERQEEINLQKEEIMAQYETLESTNLLLQEHQKRIEEQNAELDKHRNKLEHLVEVRTRELEKALLKAEESDRLKTSFLTNMSHEIRTPMNAIIGFTSLLKDDSLHNEHSEFIKIIESNGKSLLTLINDILELSSIQSLQVSLIPKNNNLYYFLKKLHETFILETDKKKLSLRLNTVILEKDFSTGFDEIRLKQVIGNLLSNALKFTENGYIEFGVLEKTDKITFFVKDTGIGIPENTGNAIFERFYKVEDNSQLYRGTGLGLAICKSIISLWNGEIWYESGKGKGTIFYFTLPVFSVSTTNVQQTDEKKTGNIDLKGKTILIAEDETSNYRLLESYFKKTGARIVWVKNGIEALQAANECNFDLVLMDIKMPQMGGIEASQKLKALYPNLPVIAQTAYAFKNEIEEIMASGIDSYITKPVHRDKLFELISKFL